MRRNKRTFHFFSCKCKGVTQCSDKTFKVHDALVRYIQNTWTSHHYIRQHSHHVTFVTFRPRLARFGHDHECNPSGVLLAHRRIRRGTSEAS